MGGGVGWGPVLRRQSLYPTELRGRRFQRGGSGHMELNFINCELPGDYQVQAPSPPLRGPKVTNRGERFHGPVAPPRVRNSAGQAAVVAPAEVTGRSRTGAPHSMGPSVLDQL
jgi:hypothetical protein